MCLMDYQLGRLCRSVRHPSAPNATVTLQPSQQRVGILFSIEDAVAIGDDCLRVIVDNDTLSTIHLTAGSDPYMISITSHGDLPLHKFTISTINSVENFAVTEFFMPEDYLNMPLEELEHKYMPWRKQA